MKQLYGEKFLRLRNFCKVFLAFLSVSFYSTYSQSYPESVPADAANFQDYSPPTGPLPEYLEVSTNNFGNEVLRISDSNVFGTTGQNLRHHYSKDQPWNSDGSLIKLNGYPAAILDGETNEFMYWASIPSSATWSNSNPNKMYGTSGNKLVSYDVNTDQRTDVKVFSGYTSISYGYGEGNTSNDDRYIGLIGLSGSNQTLIVYDIINDVIVGTDNIGSDNIDWFSVSPLGGYAVANYGADGNAEDEGLWRYSIDMQDKIFLTENTEHADLGVDANGNEVYVTFADNPTRDQDYYLRMIRLSDAHQTNLFYHPDGYGVWNGHVSCRNNLRPGWAYISEGCCDTDGEKEIIAVKLDESNLIERYGMHHTVAQSGYGHESHAVPNRDGTQVMFASNWANGFTGSYPPSFIVRASSESLSLGEEQVASSNILVYPNPTTDGKIQVKLNGIQVDKVDLHDLLGRNILSEDMNGLEKTFYLGNLPQGIYIMSFNVKNSNSLVSKKIVVK